MRIGIDVGGTHTDAVILDGDNIVAATKTLTSADVITGVDTAIDVVLKQAALSPGHLKSVMIGTTQFTNAVVERRELSPVAAIRLGLPSGRGLPPMIDWPDDLRGCVETAVYQLKGGTLYDGDALAPLDEVGLDAAIDDIKARGINNIAVSAAFSAIDPMPERHVQQKLEAAIDGVRVTLSQSFGRLGLVERENASILNAMLRPFADRVVSAFLDAVKRRNIQCPVFISQNDGTLMGENFVRLFPALTFSSGPTNSLRGAYKLMGLEDAIVVDIGGTTADIGVLQKGFPRESSSIIHIGGVRTNFRMPDILALGLGGGSLVSPDGMTIGPQSVGHALTSEGLVFGGNVLTATDLAVAHGRTGIGDAAAVAHLSPATVKAGVATMHQMLNDHIEMMRPGGKPMPVILVGGGSVLVSEELPSASSLHRPEHADVANAVGAAIAQIGGEAEQLVSYKAVPRPDALRAVTQIARDNAIKAGAAPDTLQTVDVEETAVPYMDESSTRLRVKVLGDIDQRS